MRIYVDTSVFGGYFDPEFQEPTRQLFERFRRGEERLVLSELTLDELRGAPLRVRELPETLPPEHVERMGPRSDAAPLAKLYIEEHIMRPSMYFDALHIALAVVARVDLLVSWNFRDFVNVHKIRGYNAINRRLGYPAIDIRQPREVITYGN